MELVGNIKPILFETNGSDESLVINVKYNNPPSGQTVELNYTVVFDKYKKASFDIGSVLKQILEWPSLDIKALASEKVTYSALPNITLEFIPNSGGSISDTNTATFDVIDGGVSNLSGNIVQWLKANFLTWQPNEIKSKWNQPQYISYVVCQDALKLKYKAYYANAPKERTGVIKPKGSTSEVMTNNRLCRADVSFVSLFTESEKPYAFDVYVEGPAGVTFPIQRYIIDTAETKYQDLYLYKNSLGGYDTLLLKGKKTLVTKSESELTGGKTIEEFNETSEKLYRKNSGYLSLREIKSQLGELIGSSDRYCMNAESVFEKMVMAEGVECESTQNELTQMTFSYRFAKSSPYQNLSRVDLNETPLVIEGSNNELFPLAPRLIDFQNASVGANPLILMQHPGESTWRKMALTDLINELGQSGPGGVSDHDKLKNIIDAEIPDLADSQKGVHLNGVLAKRLRSINQSRIDSWDNKLGVGDTATNSNQLGGRNASDYYHLENSNKPTISWEMAEALVHDKISFHKNSNAAGGYDTAFIRHDNEGNVDQSKLIFELADDPADWFEYRIWDGYNTTYKTPLVVKSAQSWFNGKLGVNTNNPTEALDVVGNIKATREVKAQSANITNMLRASSAILENLTVTGRLNCNVLEANHTRVSNGDLWIQNSCRISLIDNTPGCDEFMFSIDESILELNDLCIIQSKRSNGSMASLTFEVIGYELDPSAPNYLIGKVISGTQEYIQSDDLIVQIGNTRDKSRQSGILNCVSFEGNGAATLYYSGVDSIPSGSFYPDKSKIKSALGDLRALDPKYGDAAIYTTNGHFKGHVEANSGKFGNFSINNDNIAAEYITMTDGLLPSIASLDKGEITVATPAYNQVGFDSIVEGEVTRDIDVKYDFTLLCGYDVDNTISAWTEFYRANGTSHNYEYCKVLIYRIDGNTQTLVYEQNMTLYGDYMYGEQIKIDLPKGYYRMINKARVRVVKGGGTLQLNLNGYKLKPTSAMNYIGSNGMMTYYGKDNYLRFVSDEEFTIRKGKYMLRVSETNGIQKSNNEGNTWQNI